MSLSNFPPGHPTGVSHSELTMVFECEPCNRLWTPEDHDAMKLRLQLKHGKKPTCPGCKQPLQRATCDTCGKPATHIDEDRSVNFFLPFCDKHSM